MAIPQQVKDRAENADKLMEEAAEKNAEEEVIGDVPDVPAKEEGGVVEEEKVVESLNQRYKVLKGKYDTEITAKNQEIARLNSTVESILSQNNENSRLIKELQEQITENKAPEEEGEGAPAGNVLDFIPTKFISEGDLEKLDDEGLDEGILQIIGNALLKANQANNPAPQTDVENRVKKLEDEKKVEAESKVRSAEDTFWDKVEGMSGYAEHHVSEEFKQFLGEKAPYSKFTKQQILNQAVSNLEFDVVSNLFSDFKKTKGIKDKAAPDKPDLESQIEPGPSLGEDVNLKGPAKGKLSDKEVVAKWTPEAIRQFTTDVTRGEYREDSEGKKRNEAEIWRANLILQGVQSP